MSSYELQLFLHVTAVIFALGATFAFPFLQAFAERRGVASTRFALQFTQHLDKWVVMPGGALVGLFGIGLVFDDDLGYKSDMPAWLWVSIAWYVVAYVMAMTVLRRSTSAAVRSLEGVPEGAELPPAYTAAAKQMQMLGGLLGLSVIVIAFLMTAKP